eukprot:2915402-Pyramimonas_sp.AAC.1
MLTSSKKSTPSGVLASPRSARQQTALLAMQEPKWVARRRRPLRPPRAPPLGARMFVLCLLYTSDAADDTPCVDL